MPLHVPVHNASHDLTRSFAPSALQPWVLYPVYVGLNWQWSLRSYPDGLVPPLLTLSLATVHSPSLPRPTMPLPRSPRRLSTAFWLTRTPSQLCFSVMLSLVLLSRPKKCPRVRPP